jgi:hypothetical protein
MENKDEICNRHIGKNNTSSNESGMSNFDGERGGTASWQRIL